MKPDIIITMKNILQIDRLIILVGSICLLASLFLTGQEELGLVYITGVLFVILLIRYVLFVSKDQRKCIPDCRRSREASNILLELATEMHVRLCETKPLEVLAQFNGARTDGKAVQLGSSLLYGLDDAALKGVLAHELGHIQKGHILWENYHFSYSCLLWYLCHLHQSQSPCWAFPFS